MPMPPPAFYFAVSLADGASPAQFQEVSGIYSAMETEDVEEGGENRFAHLLPTRSASGNLFLKRGRIALGSPLFDWIRQTIEVQLDRPITPQTLIVGLRGADDKILVRWTVADARAVKWAIAGDDADGTVLIEMLEFAYSSVTRAVSAG